MAIKKLLNRGYYLTIKEGILIYVKNSYEVLYTNDATIKSNKEE